MARSQDDPNRVLTIEEYVFKSKVNLTQIYSKLESENIINEHTIALYKGRVTLNDDSLTGYEVAEKLHIIHESFERKFNEAWNIEFPDDRIGVK